MTTNWFEVDKEGLRSLVERRGHGWLLFELIQNALDTDASQIEVRATPVAGKPQVEIEVTDDSTHGFLDLSHAWTMFAPSTKAADPELRGRFNIGEKLFLSLATEASIETTTGTVTFDQAGRHRSAKSLPRGTRVAATVRMTRDEFDGMMSEVDLLLPPPLVVLRINDERRHHRVPLATTSTQLMTEYADEDGRLHRTKRTTSVSFVQVAPGEQATIFEMGLPIVETEAPWHIDVGQTVPLSMDRDNVTPAYARDLYALALDTMASELDEEQASQPWAATGMEKATPEAVQAVVEKRFGSDAVVFDPRAPESNKKALDQGRTVIPGAAFTRPQWERVREARETAPGFAQPAGKALPTGVPTSPDGVEPIPESEWTPGMRRLARYARSLARHAIVPLSTVEFHRLKSQRFAAWVGGTKLTFNLSHLHQPWISNGSEPTDDERLRLDALIIHEFAHLDGASDHLTMAFSDACCRIGAELRGSMAAL